MDQQQATQFVIHELGRHRKRDEIIRALCENMGLNWKQAQQFIQEVEAQNQSVIALRQSPIILILGIGTIIGGLILAGTMLILTLQGYVIFFLTLPIPYLGNVTYFVTGLAMVVGGLSGIWTTVRQLLG